MLEIPDKFFIKIENWPLIILIHTETQIYSHFNVIKVVFTNTVPTCLSNQ